MNAICLAFAIWAAAGPAPENIAVDEIMKRSLERERQNVRALDNYTFEQVSITKTYDGSGKLKKTETQVEEVLQLDGSRYEKLIEENGKPLPPAKAKREQEKMDRELARRRNESESAKQKRLREEAKRREEERKLREEVEAPGRGHGSGLALLEDRGRSQAWFQGPNPLRQDAAPEDARHTVGRSEHL